MLKVHETTRADGSLAPVFLIASGGDLAITEEDGAAPGERRTLPLPPGALVAVMRRYGRPLDPAARIVAVDALDLGDGSVLRHVRHLATYDVIARDWLVYEAPSDEPICALATNVAGALAHLARAASREGS